MPLDAIVTDLTTVPEALHSEYLEKDGKFYLQVKPVDGWDLQDIGGLTRSLQAERALKTQAEKALAPFKGLDPETARTAVNQLGEFEGLTPAEAKALKTELEGLKAAPKGAKLEEQVAAAVTAAKTEMERLFGSKQTEFQSALETAKSSEAALRSQLKTLLVDNDLKTELGKVKLVPGVQPAVEMLLSRSVQVSDKANGEIERVVVDAAGEPRFKLEGTSLVPMTIGDLVAELKVQMPAMFAADAPSGTGIPAGGGSASPTAGLKNPWVAGPNFNRTEQVLMKKNNPKQAAAMMAAAGVAA